MRRTDSNLWHRLTDLMRSASVLLLSALTMLAVVSCSGSGDDPETPGTTPERPDEHEEDLPILFSASEQEEGSVTRADTPLENTFTSFVVYGFKNKDGDNGLNETYQTVFPGYVVKWETNSANTTNTNTDGWEYVNMQPAGQEEQTIKYWDMSSSAYRFFGVAGATRTNVVTGSEETVEGRKMYKVTYEADATKENETPYYSHLWYSTGDLSVYPYRQFGMPVQLQFIKPLSQVRFMFIFEDPSKARETELTSKSFSPSNGSTIKMKGDVTVRYPLTGTDITETFASTAEAEGMIELKLDYYESVTTETLNPGTENEKTVVVSPYLGADASKTRKVYTVLPVIDQGSYTLKVSVNGEPKSTIVPAEFMDWKPGYLYTYVFKIHVDNGVSISSVQSAFTEWTIDEKEHIVHNW